VISLSEALGREVEFEWAVGRLVDGFAEYFQAVFTPAPLSGSEIERVRLIERERYSNSAWTLSGKVAFSRAE
jgi:lipoate-protein ligase A